MVRQSVYTHDFRYHVQSLVSDAIYSRRRTLLSKGLTAKVVLVLVLLMLTSSISMRVETSASDPAPPLLLEPGEGNFTYIDDGGNINRPVRVFYVYPETFDTADEPRIVFIMHGYYRNAEDRVRTYRAYAHAYDALFLFPEFTFESWPDSDYFHRGNILNENGDMNPQDDWSYSTILEIFDLVTASIPNPPDKFDIQGHSAGAQFVHRMALLMPEAPFRQIVVANAGSFILPTYDETYPYGIADMDISIADLATAFARDLTLTLGTLDNDPNADLLSHSDWSEAQGPHRFARGHFYYDYCKSMAANLSLPFRWKLVEVEGVGHSPNGMSPSAVEAIFGNHSTSFTPLDDTHIKYNHNNYGANLQIQVDADYGMRAYLKFDLTSLAGVQIKFASLRLNVTDSSRGLQFVHYVPDNSWSEDTLTNDTKPDFAEQVSTGYGGIENITTVIRLTEFVRAHLGEVVSLYMETNSSDGFYFSSKEAGHAPEIIVWVVEEPPQTSTVNLIHAGDGWCYSEVDPQPDLNWNVPGFDDDAWLTGLGPLGYGDPTSYGTVLNDTGGSYYFRKEFYVAPGDEYENLTLYVASNNFAMVYLNGILVDDDSGADHGFAYWNRVVSIPGDYLLEGTNTIAVYVYNSAGSSEAYFDLELKGERIGPGLPNQPPTITASDITSAEEDTLYSNTYTASDPENNILTWSLETEANWLTMNPSSGILSGTPTLADVGTCSVNVTVTDSHGASDSSQFDLTVYMVIPLSPGWNLVSIPLDVQDMAVEDLLQSIDGKYDSVEVYDTGDQDSPWKIYHSSKPSHMNDNIEISKNMGFWLHVTDPLGATLTMSGTRLAGIQDIALNRGWNLVGFPSMIPQVVSDVTSDLNQPVQITGIDSSQGYPSCSIMNADDLLLPKNGYWVYSPVSQVWSLNPLG